MCKLNFYAVLIVYKILGRNLLLHPRSLLLVPCDSVSVLSIRFMTRLVTFWDQLAPSRKPMLSEVLNSASVQAEIGSSLVYGVYKEILRVLLRFDQNIQEGIGVLELLIVCLHTQRSFADVFFKDHSLVSNISLKTKFYDRFFDFCMKVKSLEDYQFLNKQ